MGDHGEDLTIDTPFSGMSPSFNTLTHQTSYRQYDKKGKQKKNYYQFNHVSTMDGIWRQFFFSVLSCFGCAGENTMEIMKINFPLWWVPMCCSNLKFKLFQVAELQYKRFQEVRKLDFHSLCFWIIESFMQCNFFYCRVDGNCLSVFNKEDRIP